MADLSNKFITQSEVDDKRKRRQEEWEQKRKPDDPMECPEADNRSLYDKLQEQKMKKDEEYEEQHKLKNSVKGLNEDEAHFLEFVSNKQLEIEKARSDEEKSLFKEIKESSVSAVQQSSSQEKKSTKPAVQTNKRSQTALLAGAVKRKGTSENEDSNKRKSIDNKDPESTSNTGAINTIAREQLLNQRAKIIGVLPGLGAYDNDTSDSETSSSDSECDFSVQKKIKIQVNTQ
ncbi:PSME3-interacting protein-like [Mytilus galloprovincialis]|uniref:PSME3-interacting protein-like n=1 Tax=Mytilus galloprovincialis TaxID=29158 RepID=UPI003F7B55AD